MDARAGFVYNRAMNPAHITFAKPQLSVLRAMVVRLHQWGLPNMSAPFWRLYAMDAPGCRLRWQGEAYALVPGKMCLIAPDTPFAGEVAGTPRQFFIHFTLGLPLDATGPWIQTWTPSRAVQGIVRDAFLGEARPRPVRSLDILSLVLEALQQLPAERWEEPVDDERVNAAIRLMEQHLRRPLSNQELAAHVHMSLRSFQRLFVNHVHMAPGQYVLRLRLNHAAMLLHETRWSLERIAEECGFCDRFAFTKTFTQHRGVSPARYRRHHAAHWPW